MSGLYEMMLMIVTAVHTGYTLSCRDTATQRSTVIIAGSLFPGLFLQHLHTSLSLCISPQATYLHRSLAQPAATLVCLQVLASSRTSCSGSTNTCTALYQDSCMQLNAEWFDTACHG